MTPPVVVPSSIPSTAMEMRGVGPAPPPPVGHLHPSAARAARVAGGAFSLIPIPHQHAAHLHHAQPTPLGRAANAAVTAAAAPTSGATHGSRESAADAIAPTAPREAPPECAAPPRGAAGPAAPTGRTHRRRLLGSGASRDPRRDR